MTWFVLGLVLGCAVMMLLIVYLVLQEWPRD